MTVLQDEFEPTERDVVSMAPSTEYIWQLLFKGMGAWGLVTFATCFGLAGILTGEGASSHGTRGMTPGSTESLIVSWVFLVVGGLGTLLIPMVTVWNSFLRETVEVDETSVILRRSLWGMSWEKRIPRWSVHDVRVPNEIWHPKKTAWAFWDITLSTSLSVTTDTQTYGIAVGVDLKNARAAQNRIRELLNKTTAICRT